MEQVLNYQQHFNLMKFIKNFILILLFILPISNSFGAMVTHNQTETVNAVKWWSSSWYRV